MSPDFILKPKAQRFILWVIVANAITLGMDTSPYFVARYGNLLAFVDFMALAIFTVELALKIYVLRKRFFKDPWNVFDFIVVAISYVPATGSLAVLRSLRVLRVLRLVSNLPKLRMIVQSLLHCLPSIAWLAVLMLIIFYIFAVIATNSFNKTDPTMFGTMPKSLFTLFQVMTLDCWAMNITRPLMEDYPYAPLLFVPFVLITSFVILNLFVAVIVNGMSAVQKNLTQDSVKQKKQTSSKQKSKAELRVEIKRLKEQIERIESMI